MDSERYRRYALQLRTIATDDPDGSSRNALLTIASNYEHAAQTLDAIERRNKYVRKFQ